MILEHAHSPSMNQLHVRELLLSLDGMLVHCRWAFWLTITGKCWNFRVETRPRRDLSADFSIWCPAPTTQWYASAPPTFWTLYGCQYRSPFSQHDVARNRLIDNAALYKTNLCVVEGIRTLTLSDSLFLLPFRTFQARSAYNWVARTLKKQLIATCCATCLAIYEHVQNHSMCGSNDKKIRIQHWIGIRLTVFMDRV